VTEGRNAVHGVRFWPDSVAKIVEWSSYRLSGRCRPLRLTKVYSVNGHWRLLRCLSLFAVCLCLYSGGGRSNAPVRTLWWSSVDGNQAT